MLEELCIPLSGMDLKCKIFADGDDYVEEVAEVSVWDGKKYVKVNCDLETFLEDNQDVLNEALAQKREDAKIAYAEMRMDAAREEGRL